MRARLLHTNGVPRRCAYWIVGLRDELFAVATEEAERTPRAALTTRYAHAHDLAFALGHNADILDCHDTFSLRGVVLTVKALR
jgi:hypothetical protein